MMEYSIRVLHGWWEPFIPCFRRPRLLYTTYAVLHEASRIRNWAIQQRNEIFSYNQMYFILLDKFYESSSHSSWFKVCVKRAFTMADWRTHGSLTWELFQGSTNSVYVTRVYRVAASGDVSACIKVSIHWNLCVSLLLARIDKFMHGSSTQKFQWIHGWLL